MDSTLPSVERSTRRVTLPSMFTFSICGHTGSTLFTRFCSATPAEILTMVGVSWAAEYPHRISRRSRQVIRRVIEKLNHIPTDGKRETLNRCDKAIRYP